MEGFQIGAVQMNPRIDDLEHNLATHVRLIHEAADAGCRLVVFPELSVTAHYGDEKMVQFAEASDHGRIFNTMHSQAREQEIVVAYGFAEIAHGTFYNSYALVGPQGLIGVQRKLPASHNEYFSFRMGRTLEVFDLGFCKIGTLICYDAHFFEAWRVLALKEADVILLPHAVRTGWGQEIPSEELTRRLSDVLLGLPGYEGAFTSKERGNSDDYVRLSDQVMHGVYAKSNAVFAVYANQVGYNGHSTHLGGAHIVDPTGQVIAKSEPLLDDLWISAALDPQLLIKMRRSPWCTLKIRRPEMYTELTRMI